MRSLAPDLAVGGCRRGGGHGLGAEDAVDCWVAFRFRCCRHDL
uniref:Uncharacterized protein n=1 Tax=Fagus sylvatica TaxID=28930 RepID=A0A2N9IEQ1_FAGSY